MTFKFAGARAQVCKYCNFLVARTDRGLASMGRVADLVEIPSPLAVGVTGYWNGKRFEVEGRVQLDRVGAASAPWQEFYVALVDSGEGFWVAYAQGRWYWTRDVQPTPQLPALHGLRPGVSMPLSGAGMITVAEVGQRRVISAEGELPDVAMPGGVTPYVDFGAQGNVFGTLDYGDGGAIPPKLFVGAQFDPASFKLDSGQPMEVKAAEVTAVTCPGCGGSLPLAAAGTSERIVCRYCGMASDIKQGGVLAALGHAPRPTEQPFIPLGSEGLLRDRQVTVIGFMVRGTWVEGEHYTWREYLLYAGPNGGYVWLLEEERKWQLAVPIPPGEALIRRGAVDYQNRHYHFKQSVEARVECVIGEFYWKVEVGETVQASEYTGAGGLVSVEQDQNEQNASFCYPVTADEVGRAFRIAAPPSPGLFDGAAAAAEESGINWGKVIVWAIIILILIIWLSSDGCDGGSSGGGSGFYVGPSFGGK